MGRPPATAGGRAVGVTVRLSAGELALLDEIRGSLTRSEFLRMLLNRAKWGHTGG